MCPNAVYRTMQAEGAAKSARVDAFGEQHISRRAADPFPESVRQLAEQHDRPAATERQDRLTTAASA